MPRLLTDHPQFDSQLEPSTRAELKQTSDRLDKFFEKVIAQNQLPADSYAGPDAAALKETARQAWTKNYPKFRIVKIGLIAEGHGVGGFDVHGEGHIHVAASGQGTGRAPAARARW